MPGGGFQYLSIDIETTGLPSEGPVRIVEVAVVVDAFDGGRFDRPEDPYRISFYVHPSDAPPSYVWDNAQLVAHKMHEGSGLKSSWWRAPQEIAGMWYGLRSPGGFAVLDSSVGRVICGWLQSIGFLDDEETGPYRVNLAGKNVAAFDLPLLRELTDWDGHLVGRHRIMDPGPLYLRPREDHALPNQTQCLQRAGMEDLVAHTALQDAWQVVWLLRNRYFGQRPPAELSFT